MPLAMRCGHMTLTFRCLCGRCVSRTSRKSAILKLSRLHPALAAGFRWQKPAEQGGSSTIFNPFHTIPFACCERSSAPFAAVPPHPVPHRTTAMWVAPPSSSPTEPCHAHPISPPNSPPILPQPASLACSSLTRPPLLVSVTVTVAGNGHLFLPPDPVTAVSPSVTVVSPTLIHTPPHTHTRTT